MMSLRVDVPDKVISGIEAPPTSCLNIIRRGSQLEKCLLKRRRSFFHTADDLKGFTVAV